MKFTENEMTIILLCSYLGIGKNYEVKPLSLGEWSKLCDALVMEKLEPSIIYNSDGYELKNLGYDEKFIDRVKNLVDRGAAVAFELQENENRGINTITEISSVYPIMLRRKLKKKKPPVLFYSGDISLAKKVGIGVVGSRNVSIDGMIFTESLVNRATQENMIVYSGGAKGVDTTSETVALNSGGAVVSYISDSLFSKIKKQSVSYNIASGKMLVISDQKPDAGFSAGRAMNRNKYIYASAFGTFVVESDYKKGGTWNGATEALKNGWGKVLAWNNGLQGNSKLIEAGCIPYALSESRIYDVINEEEEKKTNNEPIYKQLNLDILLKQ